MKPKRFFFRNTPLFGTTLRYGTPIFAGFVVLATGLTSDARDILRGGSSGSASSPAASVGGAPTPAATDAARANTQDILRRTSQTMDAMRAMQAAARAAALTGANNLGQGLPDVPNGLTTGGLQVSPEIATNPAKWTGAELPTETVSGGSTTVTVKQTTQQALLSWQTLNVGKETTLTFDQSAGGENTGQWIAFNKITDPTGNPTQILGNIKADGQVYIINPNGIIFGGSSQVNARGLTVSSLPINTNLVSQGLLNNRDAQFLFSGLTVPGGADGTPDFNPDSPPPSGHYGDVTVQEGAILTSPTGSGGNGGRITLVGSNVTNAGSIITGSGQTILAAGLQVGFAAHDGGDPSLRGLDVWVGDTGDYAGTATNTGLIETLTGSVSITGRDVNQLGVVDSSTSVDLNGRIDIKASYGAVANPNFDSTVEQGSGGPIFFNQHTGTVTLGQGSVTRILPDYASTKSVPGASLPERSQVNIEALAVHLDKNASLFAPSGDVSIRAGIWSYKDADGDRTIFGTDGRVEAGLTNYYSGANQRFTFDGGQIYVDEAATVSVAGSVDVFVPLSHDIITVELRGSELADSPLQRDSGVRGVSLTVDIRNTGSYNGKFWIGTPLGDVTGLAGLIESNAAQLTAAGGNISLQAGGSIVVRNDSSLDVSGGFYNHEGGTANLSALRLNGSIVAMKDATPDHVYGGVVTQTTQIDAYVEGANGGSLSIIAPSMALDGKLTGITVEGPRQRSTPPLASSLHLNFEAEKAIAIPGTSAINYIKNSPTPPAIELTSDTLLSSVPEFSVTNGVPAGLPADRLASVVLSSQLLSETGFGNLEVLNPDGTITVPEAVSLAAAPKGSITLSGANLSILGELSAPGGTLSFTTYDISPSFAAEYSILNPSGSEPFPLPVDGRGMFLLGSSANLSTAGLIADDRPGSTSSANAPIVTAGGSIQINSYNADLAAGSVIDVSGGVYLSEKGAKSYGKGGSISIVTGTDAGFSGVIGGTISLGSTLRGYSGSTGGSLSVQASLIQIGAGGDSAALRLSEDFFRTGGFTKYSLTGIGAASTATPPAGLFESYLPAISIADGTNINPLAENLLASEDPARPGVITLTPFVNDEGLRTPVSVSFNALGSDDPYTIDKLEVRGDIVMGAGSSIVTGPGASVSFKGGTVTLLGSIIAPGGKITVSGAGSFPLTASQKLSFAQALPTVHIGNAAVLSTAGTVLLKPDAYGRRVGTVFSGGTISVSGNIVAEKGSLLDVSGTSGVLDLDPAFLAGGTSTGGVTSTPGGIQGIATRIDSDGGMIDLTGSQLLLSDATLVGKSGGATATGGELSVFSGSFYREGDGRTGADINLVVQQGGDVILNPTAAIGVGIRLTDGAGVAYGNGGAFSLDRFIEGSFSSLSLGGKYLAGASPIPYGGNVQFDGRIDLQVGGTLRLAAGGVIKANDSVNISASYASIGQNFLAPQNPDDVYLPFLKDPALPTSEYHIAPTFGTGNLSLNAGLIDVGTLSLQGIGSTSLNAATGDIRGNGTLSAIGDVTLTAATVYPTSLAAFSIFAYDHASTSGSVTIHSAGDSSIPLSAGGTLSIYASSIIQDGVLRAPLGTIRLGWDGSGTDAPYDIVAGSLIAAPITNSVTLGATSLTSVSAAGGENDPEWIAPFGISPDGQSWIDPRGVNVTLTGLPEKNVWITGESVDMQAGAIVDISGGGDLLASRWVPGNGGSIDLLGSPSGAWASGTVYQSGDLITYNGQTWSARVRNSGQTPTIGLYWSKVAESFAVIPTSSLAYAPYNAYNTGSNATSLAGNPGYVSQGLSVGDTITLEAGAGLPAGTYTLLPRQYVLLPGAYLVTPVGGGGVGTIMSPDGSFQVSGYLANSFNPVVEDPLVRARFEIAPASVVQRRATYDTYSADVFLKSIADQQEQGNPQQLPGDAGYALFHGNSALQINGLLRAQAEGIGARVDVSSFADIHLVGSPALASGSGVVVQTSVLTSWGAESILIGGVRTRNASGGTSLDVRTDNLILDAPGGDLSADDVILVSKGALTITDGSSVSSNGDPSFVADPIALAGDGTLLRVCADPGTITNRTGVTGLSSALLSIGSGTSFSGGSVVLDSTYGTNLASDLQFNTRNLTLGSGRISILLDGASGVLAGSTVDPQLILDGATLDRVMQSQNLTLQSYRGIDLYGSGVLGGTNLESLTLIGSGLRGYEQTGGNVVIRATDVIFNNSIAASSTTAAAGMSGSLQVEANEIRMGANSFAVTGYQNLVLNASERLLVQDTGSFSTAGAFHANVPLITGDSGATYSITAAQDMVLARGAGVAPITGTLGAGLTLEAATILADTDILLPSGQLTLRATSGDLEISGNLSVEGSSKEFVDLVRYANAGTINLESATGNVMLTAGGSLSVAGAQGGGNAGTLNVKASHGAFSTAAALDGSAADGFDSGAFTLDTGSFDATGGGSLATLDAELDLGGFTFSRGFRVRTGDVNIDHIIHSHDFSLAADQGNVFVSGAIDASGKTGGSISLAAHGDLTLASGASLTVAADEFDNAGKGGSVLLEAGTQRDGIANLSAMLDLQAGSSIDLSVAEYVAGAYNEPGSSAFEGKFTGTLHLRAPRSATNDDLQIASIQSDITGVSSVVAEGFMVYAPADGVLDISQRNQIDTDAVAFLGAGGVGNANEVAMRGKLLSGAANPSELDSLLVIAPGAEIINPTGDLVLGLANTNGTTNKEALAGADWDLSGFRYGARSAPGVLTLRANGDLVFNNTLSDGFVPIAQGSTATFADNGHSLMWMATLSTISESLPTNTQSWSYRLTAGADTNSSNFRSVLSTDELDRLHPSGGSVLVGEFYDAIPNSNSTGTAAAIGSNGQTADSIRISTSTSNRGNRFEVVRTGTGDITVSAGRDVQLRNQFATIYTAGVALPTPTTIYSENDFVTPTLPATSSRAPSQSGGAGVTLGAVQQLYPTTWSMAGGNISVSAQADIGHFTMVDGVLTVDSSRQTPTNWLYRRGYVDSSTGLFANDGGFGTNANPNFQNSDNVTDLATSTTWWIDYSNFFEGIGALGGGNVSLRAGHDVVNVDAVAPTNARMPGRMLNPDFGIVPDAPEYLNIAPDASKLLELGGGDVTVIAGRNIDGGAYYVERGSGELAAGGSITTNAARSPSLGIIDGTAAFDPLTWLPTTLFVGKSHFDVSARGDVLLGPVANPFLLPQGVSNKYWYKTYFNTFSPDAGVTVSSYGGSVTHRLEVTLPDSGISRSILDVWFSTQNLFTGLSSEYNASNYQPWLRLVESDLTTFSGIFSLAPPNLQSTAFAGDLNLVGSWTLAPSSQGNLELAAAGGILGLQNTGIGRVNNRDVSVWTSATINVSDASPESIPGVANPLSYQSVTGRDRVAAVQSLVDILQNVNLALSETGSYSGLAGTTLVKQALHGTEILHQDDLNPVRLYASGGDISGFSLFSPKQTRIIARRDITDIAFYLQNVSADDVTLVSAGRDIIPFNESAPIRSLASNLDAGNLVGDIPSATASGNNVRAMAGDIQINGPGVLEVLSGRNIDLGTGSNFLDGTGVGITSIGNIRNPNLPFGGADIISLTGVSSPDGQGPAEGLSISSMLFAAFIESYLPAPDEFDSTYLKKLGSGKSFDDLTLEQKAIVALEKFYQELKTSGRNPGPNSKYTEGYDAVAALFGTGNQAGEMFTRAREIRTTTGGSISLGVPGGGITMASEIFGNPLTPPGIVTEYGGNISTFTDGSVDIGQARIFTLRGGDIIMWSSSANIAAGTSARTVVTAPPTRVVIDISSADVQTDLGGLATGGGIGVLASVEGVDAGNVDLIAPKGYIDAGDAGIRVTGNLNIAAQVVLNAGNISAGGSTTGSAVSAPAAPGLSTVASASNAAAATSTTAAKPTDDPKTNEQPRDSMVLSVFTVEVIGYGGGSSDEDEDKDKEKDEKEADEQI